MERLEKTVKRLREIFEKYPNDTEFINETLQLFLLANTDKDVVIDGNLECNGLHLKGNLFVFGSIDAGDVHCNEYKVGHNSCTGKVTIENDTTS